MSKNSIKMAIVGGGYIDLSNGVLVPFIPFMQKSLFMKVAQITLEPHLFKV